MSEEEFKECEECKSTEFEESNEEGTVILKCKTCGKEYCFFETDEAFEKYVQRKLFERLGGI